MSTIVYQVNKKTGVKYAYESISYWDKEKQAPRSKRKYIGRVDPETGEIIKARDAKASALVEESNERIDQLNDVIREKDSEIEALQSEIKALNKQIQDLNKKIAKIHSLTSPEE